MRDLSATQIRWAYWQIEEPRTVPQGAVVQLVLRSAAGIVTTGTEG